ncbi:MAG TPA: amidohydrolase [Thermoanaerobaculia bacterium]|nr:amidohydrolase [Thermoanaerobaculia bacterium]
MRRILFVLTCTLALSCASAAPQRTDLVLVNGKVFTADEAKPWAEAVAIRDDRILAVGTTVEIRAIADTATRVIDLRGRTMVPGINDAHVHEPWSVPGTDIGITPDATVDVMLARLGSATARHPSGTWLTGEVPVTLLDDPRLHRDTLDVAAPQHPVRLGILGGHAVLLNSAALRAWNVGENQTDPRGGWYGRTDGRLNGWVYEHAAWAKMGDHASRQSDETLVAAMNRFAAEAVRLGITTVQSMPLIPVDRLARLEPQTSVGLRWRWIDLMMAQVATEPRRAVKYILDGTPIERNAALRSPYADRPSMEGRLNYSVDEISRFVEVAARSPHQLLVHVAGDAGLEELFAAMRRANVDWSGKRVRIEHGDFLGRYLHDAKELGIVLVQNPSHFMLADLLQARYGATRLRDFGAFRTAMERDIPVAIGSDGPINPWLNVMFAAMHPANPDQRVTRERAVIAYTAGSAYAEMEEDEKGTIVPGKLADLAVLSQDIFAVPLEELPKTQSVLTIIGGRVVHDNR